MDDGEPCGQGVKTMPDGTRYEGELSGGTFKGILVEDAS